MLWYPNGTRISRADIKRYGKIENLRKILLRCNILFVCCHAVEICFRGCGLHTITPDVFTSESFTTYGFHTESWQWHQVFDCKRFGSIPYLECCLCSNKKVAIYIVHRDMTLENLTFEPLADLRAFGESVKGVDQNLIHSSLPNCLSHLSESHCL